VSAQRRALQIARALQCGWFTRRELAVFGSCSGRTVKRVMAAMKRAGWNVHAEPSRESAGPGDCPELHYHADPGGATP